MIGSARGKSAMVMIPPPTVHFETSAATPALPGLIWVVMAAPFVVLITSTRLPPDL
jgi:hypothetical protein